MNITIKTILVFFIFISITHAENTVLSGIVDQLDLRHRTIVINTHPYAIKPGTRVNNRAQLKPGSVVEFTLNNRQEIDALYIKPNFQVRLPPINN